MDLIFVEILQISSALGQNAVGVELPASIFTQSDFGGARVEPRPGMASLPRILMWWLPVLVLLATYLEPVIASIPSRPITWIKHVVICIGVRKDSLRKRHGGHGFAYNYVASMLATFSSRMVYAALMGHFVPHPRDFKVGRRMSEATVCWMLVYAIPVGVFANLCGHSIHARWTRSALYLAAALNKFQHVRRILFLVRHRAMPNQIAIMAATGAASTLSRAVTNQWVTSAADEDVEVWLGGLRRVSVELRRNAALGAVEFFLRSDQLESLEALVQCDGKLGSSMMPLCLDADMSVAIRARQAIHLLVMAYLVNMYLRRAAKSVAFKRKPPKVKRS